MKLAFLLALLTALGLFGIFLAVQLADPPYGGERDGIGILALVSAVMALAVAVIQIAGLGLLRLLPWDGPSLKVEGDDHLRRVFE